MIVGKVVILSIIFTKLQARVVQKLSSTQGPIWPRFDCHANSDCPPQKYCLAWKCAARHKGFCLNDGECAPHEWCNVQHLCVPKSWCDGDLECKSNECCAKIVPLSQGTCLPLIKPGELCLIESVLCPCVKGFYCKPTSKSLGRCAEDPDTTK